MATPQYIKNAQNAYNAKFDLVQLKLPKGTKERIKAVLEGEQSITSYCVQSVIERLEADEDETLQEPIHATQDAEMGPEHTETRKPTNNLEKSEAEVDETHAEPLPSSEPCIENGFDGLKAADWTPEKHKGIIPYPPHWASENATWEAGIREWCEPLPFE